MTMTLKLPTATDIAWTHCFVLPAMVSLFVLALIVGSGWELLLRGTVISYGDPKDSYFTPATVKEGDDIHICFNDLEWLRICPSMLITYLTPSGGPRLDLPVYPVSVPQDTGKVPPKCRAWKVPYLGPMRSEGSATVSGYMESRCTLLDKLFDRPIYTPMPSLKITIAGPVQR